jgi:uncharacterized membrane protein
VLIASFGGAAGMVALTRRSFSNVVPGVAIATALMPPLCTAGFGLAHGQWEMFAGAFYLFLINGVFIAASTLAVSKLVQLPPVNEVDPAVRARHRALITVGLIVVLVPSVWLGVRFVQQELFAVNAQALVRQLEADTRLAMVSHTINRAQKQVSVLVVGAEAEQKLREQTPSLLAQHGLKDAQLLVRRAGGDGIDMGRIREQLQADVRRDVTQLLSERLARSEETRDALQVRLNELTLRQQQAQALAPAVLAELRAQQPDVRAATLAQGRRVTPATRPASAAASSTDLITVVVLEVSRPLKPTERERLSAWLSLRLGSGPVDLIERVMNESAVRRPQ